MQDSLTIRRAESSDLGSVIGLRIEFERITRDSGSLDEEARVAQLSALLGRDLAEGRLRCWIAELGGWVAGQAALRLRRGSAAGEILNVYTVPACRGMGIASTLLAAAIAEARELGLARLVLQPTDDSRRIYERAGFRIAGRGMELMLRARRP